MTKEKESKWKIFVIWKQMNLIFIVKIDKSSCV